MKLPEIETALVEAEKVRDYLLNPAHPDGWGKARFFLGVGFRREEWTVLAEALRRMARDYPVVRSVTSPHGSKYIIDGMLRTPGGQTPSVRSVWIVDARAARPRLVTAYPNEGEEQP